MVSKEWIARIKNDAVKYARLEPGFTELTPLLNDDTLYAEQARLVDAVPAHLRDHVRAYVHEAARAYTEGLLAAIGNAAKAVGNRLELRSYDVAAKLDASIEAQDLASLAVSVYSSGASYISSTSTPAFDVAQNVAAEGVKYTLKTYALNSHLDEFNRYADAGKIAEAVFGTMPAFYVTHALTKGAFKVTHFGGINQNVTITLDPIPDDTGFSPPLVVGWTYAGLDRKDGSLKAVARSQLYAILPDTQHASFLRQGTNEHLTKLLNNGIFKLENDEHGRVFGYPAMVLRVTSGSGYTATPTFMRVVPLGDFVVKHVSRIEVGAHALNDYANLLRGLGYQVSYGAKKDAAGPAIGKDKSGHVKWISPDPFAKD